MKEMKTVLTVPWAGVESSWRNGTSGISTESDAYEKVPLIYRSLKMRCNALTRIPVYVYDENDEETDYVFEDAFPLREMLWMSESSYLLAGVAYLLKLKNPFKIGKGLQWLNPFSVTSELSGNIMRYYQSLPSGQRYPKEGYWYDKDFVLLKDFNPLDDLGAGISATSVALADAKILGSVSSFLSNFFTADALPVTMAVLPSGTQEAERARVESWFKDRLRGMRNAVARVLGVSADIKIEKLTSDLNTFDFKGVDEHAINDVAWAFDIPKTLLTSDSANFATSQSEYRSFLEYTVIPRCRFYEQHLNKYLAEFGQRIEFDEQSLPEMQADENDRASSLDSLVSAGVPLRAALDILGYDLSAEAEAELAKSEKEKPEEVPEEDTTPEDNQNLAEDENGTGTTEAD